MACRMLDRQHVPYQLLTYSWSEDDLDAVSVARKLGLSPLQIFKTLVLSGDKSGVLVAMVPGGCQLDLKKLAKATGNKRVEMVPVREIKALTGYVRGGVSPLGMMKSYPCVIDRHVREESSVSISAGVRGLQIYLAAGDLLKVLGASVEDLALAPPP